MSRTITVALGFFVSESWPFDCVLCLFCVNIRLVLSITYLLFIMMCPYAHPRPLERGQRPKHFFLKVVMLHTKLMGMEHRAQCKHIFHLYTHPRPLGWDQKVKTCQTL